MSALPTPGLQLGPSRRPQHQIHQSVHNEEGHVPEEPAEPGILQQRSHAVLVVVKGDSLSHTTDGCSGAVDSPSLWQANASIPREYCSPTDIRILVAVEEGVVEKADIVKHRAANEDGGTTNPQSVDRLGDGPFIVAVVAVPSDSDPPDLSAERVDDSRIGRIEKLPADHRDIGMPVEISRRLAEPIDVEFDIAVEKGNKVAGRLNNGLIPIDRRPSPFSRRITRTNG